MEVIVENNRLSKPLYKLIREAWILSGRVKESQFKNLTLDESIELMGRKRPDCVRCGYKCCNCKIRR